MPSGLQSAQYSYCVFSSGNNVDSIKSALSRLGWRSVPEKSMLQNDEWAVNFVWKPTWTGLRGPPVAQQWARGHSLPGKRAVSSHWKSVEPLCEKPNFFECMREYYTAIGRAYCERLPVTFIVQPRMKAEPVTWPGWKEWSASCRASAAAGEFLWLCKPADENRGIGIEVCRSEVEVRDFLASKSRGAAMGIKTHWVVQKYMERPLLTPDQRKFDLRVWCLLLDTGDAFLYAPGYVRTSSDAYDAAGGRYAHLTNYCQQVKSESFGQHEEGNTARWETLESWLSIASKKAKNMPAELSSAQSGAELLWGCNEYGVWGQIRAAVKDALGALRLRGGQRNGGFSENGFARTAPEGVVPTLDGIPRKQCPSRSGSAHRFELLGLDFLLDADLNAKFIEVNTNPSLDHQAVWHGRFVDVMVDRMLHLILSNTHPEAKLPAPLDGAETSWALTGDAAADAEAAKWRPTHGWQFVANAYLSMDTVFSVKNRDAGAKRPPVSQSRPLWRSHGPKIEAHSAPG